MQTQEIRRKFLKYFQDRHHALISSSPVIPHDDPTLLFINAGMNQFKDVFLGKTNRDYNRAVTSQKCIRVGGKHNDLENVGYTSRHLTFFEMLGNFSFGDYFKKEAIQFAWEVSTDVFGFDSDRIWPTVFRDDDEAFELWRKYVPAEKITRFGEKENFWAMGDVGPCGPCSELLYDRGSKYGNATNPLEDPTGERFLEFWNLVFMQYNRQNNGQQTLLPKPSIDTGAGLERIISLRMNVESVFETDVLRGIIAKVEEISGVAYDPTNDKKAAPFRVIADHVRCLSFAIADGVQPSNVDRGYVLRKVLRRAVRYGRSLGLEQPFLAQIFPNLVELMGEDFPELQKSKHRIEEILTSEEEAFNRTLHRGGNILNTIIDHAHTHGKKITGDEAFKLKDTYGFPIEEILLIAKDSDLEVDTNRYASLELEAKERSRNVHKTTHQIASENLFADYYEKNGVTNFLGYHEESSHSHIMALVVNNTFVEEMHEGDEGSVILDKTPFYADMGGQIGDNGILKSEQNLFEVINCLSPYKGIIAHQGKLLKGCLKVNQAIIAEINSQRRQKIENNHTATHLLHWALHIVLGEHVKQAGSVVDSNRLRFDFSHHKALGQNEVRQIEDLVNAKIRENLSVSTYEIPYIEAQKRQDIKQFFGEKYGSIVRVVDIDYSKELCGGTHTTAVGNIGLFRVAKESSIAAGVRRIEAVTGEEAEKLYRQSDDLLDKLANHLKTLPHQLLEKTEKLLEENKQFSHELKNVKKFQINDSATKLLAKVETIHNIPTLIEQFTISMEDLRDYMDVLMEKLSSGIVILGTVTEGKCHILIRISDDIVSQGHKAGDIIKHLAPIIEGSGGGKPNSAQAGGKASNKLAEALAKAKELI